MLFAILAAAREDLGEVRRQVHIAITIFSQQDWVFDLCCHGEIGNAERLQGNESAFRQHLIESLRIATNVEKFCFVEIGLGAAALLFADRGEAERAVEIYELAYQRLFVAYSQWIEDTTCKHFAAAAHSLPLEVVAAARQRGRERDPWATAKEILAELEAEYAQE